jgi:type I restriction enzyme M protein
MLDTTTKRRIDTARDILVGKVPDPKSQVEQITIALIYKFMDDMDAEGEELGGKRKFFANDYERYGWAKLMRSGLGGHETLSLYAEAIAKMPENPGIPALFRDIFKNAYLPYRDPETLKSFLKIIDEFEYDHSERLGDAFEYLLSVLGSQGDAGQFRTPRHIIDFMVEIIAPKKNEVVLDPACGTAGFLISAYKHILKSNVDVNGQSTLTPDDRKKMAENFKGYDISPDMVRLSLVNLYLHGFTNPSVFEYDTLTSEDRWKETADVILANPPFMSPKGGIKPHQRFSIQAKRSEVLFLDYIAEHLNANGRAAIIVPEGIIFQSQTAYVQLRKLLVENSLVAVVSLPAGMFNPYSGVKTSILILDKALAKQATTIGFFKIENDGFSLGAQRREGGKDDLPQVKAEIETYLDAMRARASGEELSVRFGLIVSKEKLAANEDYNLSGERYRDGDVASSVFPLRRFEEVCTLEYGVSLPKEKRNDGKFPVVGSNGITGYHDSYFLEAPAIVVGRKGSAGEVTFIEQNCTPIDTTYFVKQTNPNESDIVYLYWVLKSLQLQNLKGGAGIPGLNRTDVYEKHKLPLPPLDVQREIVTEIEGYQKIITGARAVLEYYRPHIPIKPEWETVQFSEIVSTVTPPKKIQKTEYGETGNFPIIDQSQNEISGWTDDETALVDATDGLVIFGDHTCAIKFNNGKFAQGADGIKILRCSKRFLPKYLYFAMLSKPIIPDGYKRHFTALNESTITVPPFAVQQAIVAEIEAEQVLVAANRELITRFETKIQATLARVWGDAELQAAEA